MCREGSDIIQLSGDSVNIHGRELRTLDDGVGGGGGNILKGASVTVVAFRSMVGGAGGGQTSRDVSAVTVLHNVIAGGGVDERGRRMVAVVVLVGFPERGGGADRWRIYLLFPFS